MRIIRTAVLATLLAGPASSFAQTPAAAAVKQVAYARVALAHAVASDPEIRKAVAAKNAEGESQPAIERKDREWNASPGLRKALTGSPCAERLRAMTAIDPVVVEVILMDEHGANVCLSRETSDYWQGDEPKWRRTFLEGRDPFVDDPALDASSGSYAVQLSVPVTEGARRIGVLALTLKVLKDGVGPGR
jgi:hypothetical protein